MTSFSLAAKNRAIEMVLLEYDDILDLITKKILNSTYQPPIKDVTFTASFTFTLLTWTGNSRKTDFRLAGHTILNEVTSNSPTVEDLTATVNQLPLSQLSNFIQNSSSLTGGIGLTTVNNQISEMLTQSSTISSLSSTNTTVNSRTNSMINFMSGIYSLRQTISNLLRANSKAALTEKIYVSSDVDSIQVHLISLFTYSNALFL